MEFRDIITLLVAVYGAVLSTAVFVRQMRKDRPNVKVKLSTGYLTLPFGELGDAQLVLEAANTGEKPVTLSGEFVKLPNNKTMIMPVPNTNVSFPYELLPGKNCLVWIDHKKVTNTLRHEGFHGKIKVHGAYRDQTDKLYLSKPLQLQVD